MAAILLLCGCKAQTLAESLEIQTEKTAAYVREVVQAPGVSSVGGDWAVKGLAESGLEIEQSYFNLYYDNVRAAVKSSGGAIHDPYYSDYARVVIGLCAIGADPSQVEGYNLTEPLDAYEELTKQGVNAVAYSLVAANVAGVELTQEEAYIKLLVQEMEHPAIGDFVAMSLLGLSFYQEKEEVKTAIEQGIQYLSKIQKENGSMGTCESTAETIVALSQLGIDVFQDQRFVKKGSLGESLMLYGVSDGGFSHAEKDKQENLFATEKALLALCSIEHYEKGETLYEKR